MEGNELLEELSLCNLPTPSDQKPEHSSGTNSLSHTSSAQQLFDFFTALTLSPETHTYPNKNIIFCGKIFGREDQVNEYDKKRKLSRSFSFRKSQNYQLMKDEKNRFQTKNRSKIVRFSIPNDGYPSKSKCSSLGQKVNAGSRTSDKSKGGRLFMFGWVKVKPYMEVGVVKERQGRRVLPQTVKASAGGEIVTGGDGGGGGENTYKEKKSCCIGKRFFKTLSPV